MNAREAHDQAVQRLAGEYTAKGFRVQREAVLPFATEGTQPYRADLIAERDDEHQVIEVTLRGTRGEPQGRRWSEVAQEIRSHPGWHFQIVFVDREPAAIPPADVIAKEIANAEALLGGGNLTAAILLAASAFEAAARRRLAALGALPKSGASTALVERLVSEGQLDQEDFVPLRDAIELRNAVAHGGLDAPARSRGRGAPHDARAPLAGDDMAIAPRDRPCRRRRCARRRCSCRSRARGASGPGRRPISSPKSDFRPALTR